MILEIPDDESPVPMLGVEQAADGRLERHIVLRNARTRPSPTSRTGRIEHESIDGYWCWTPSANAGAKLCAACKAAREEWRARRGAPTR